MDFQISALLHFKEKFSITWTPNDPSKT